MALKSLKVRPVVVIGGGFAGLKTVVSLTGNRPQPHVILIEPRSKFVFLPLLYEILSGEIQDWEVTYDYQSLLGSRGISYIQDSVVRINSKDQTVELSSGLTLEYAELVLCTGSISHRISKFKFKSNALTFNDLEDAIKLRELIYKIKKSTSKYKSLCIIGAGPTGVELACKLADIFNGKVKIHLVDLGSKVLSFGQSFNQEQVESSLQKRGIMVHLNTTAIPKSADIVQLQNIGFEDVQSFDLRHNGLICTAGRTPSIPDLCPEVPLKNGRLPIDEYLQVIGTRNFFALGDVAIFEKEPFPSNAQVAIQQGEIAAQNLLALRRCEMLIPFQYCDLGEMLSLGIGEATITGLGLTISGPLAFQIRRMTYLLRTPSKSLGLRSASAWFLSN